MNSRTPPLTLLSRLTPIQKCNVNEEVNELTNAKIAAYPSLIPISSLQKAVWTGTFSTKLFTRTEHLLPWNCSSKG